MIDFSLGQSRFLDTDQRGRSDRVRELPEIGCSKVHRLLDDLGTIASIPIGWATVPGSSNT
jgi:hypothetical protein